MTRKQVRAAMKRMREQNEEAEEENGEINLVPYMDIVTNIIIFLLASVVQNVSFASINVSSPTLSSGGSGAADEPEKPPLNLTVTVGASGFTLAASGGVLPGVSGTGPTVPKLPNGQYDYKALTAKLVDIKKEYPDESKVILNPDATTPYDIVVQTLDAMRVDTAGKALFPDANFSGGIL
jgi:biopolymer transport protein ExbD